MKYIILWIIILAILVIVTKRHHRINYTDTPIGLCLYRCDLDADCSYHNCKDDECCIRNCYEQKAHCYIRCLGL